MCCADFIQVTGGFLQKLFWVISPHYIRKNLRTAACAIGVAGSRMMRLRFPNHASACTNESQRKRMNSSSHIRFALHLKARGMA